MTEKTDPRAAPSPVQHGGRVELRRLPQAPSETSEDTVSYQLRWFAGAGDTPSGEGAASYNQDGTIGFEHVDAAPPWLLTFVQGLLKTQARAVRSGGQWPRRLTRWRDAPKPKK